MWRARHTGKVQPCLSAIKLHSSPGITLVCSSTSMLKFSFFTVRSVSFMVQTEMCLYLSPVTHQMGPADLMGAAGRSNSPETIYILGHRFRSQMQQCP